MELLWQWQWGARGFQRSHFLTIAFTHIRMIVIYLCKYSRESSGIAPNGVEQLDTWKGTWEPPKNVIIIFNSFLARYIIHSIFIGTQNHEKKRHFMIVGGRESESWEEASLDNYDAIMVHLWEFHMTMWIVGWRGVIVFSVNKQESSKRRFMDVTVIFFLQWIRRAQWRKVLEMENSRLLEK